MDIIGYVPSDTKELEPFGTCGPACIAVLEKKKISEVLTELGIPIPTEPMWTILKDMESHLHKFSWNTKRIQGKKSHLMRIPPTGIAIARLQHLKEDGTEYYWAEASSHTHYVLLIYDKDKDELWEFCNGNGWYCPGKGLTIGIDGAYISSYLELER